MTEQPISGLRLLDADDETIHRFSHPLKLREARDPPRSVVESWDGSHRETWNVGDPEHLRTTIHPDDLEEPLVSWIGDGGTIEVQLMTDLEDPGSGLPTRFRPVEAGDVWNSGWTDHPLRVRLDPLGDS